MPFSNSVRAMSSAGFGGIAPADITDRLGLMPEGCTISRILFSLPERNCDMPSSVSMLRYSDRRGKRRSIPMSSTFLSSSERLMAVLMAMNVFPSFGSVEVTTTTFLSLPSVKRRLVRSIRKASSVSRFSLATTAIFPEAETGISPSEGMLEYLSMSARLSIRK